VLLPLGLPFFSAFNLDLRFDYKVSIVHFQKKIENKKTTCAGDMLFLMHSEIILKEKLFT